jgi:hypothetical protein
MMSKQMWYHFVGNDGTKTTVSDDAVVYVVKKHRPAVKNGNYTIKDWMIDEMKEYDRKKGIVPPLESDFTDIFAHDDIEGIKKFWGPLKRN